MGGISGDKPPPSGTTICSSEPHDYLTKAGVDWISTQETTNNFKRTLLKEILNSRFY